MNTQELRTEIQDTKERLAVSAGAEACGLGCALIALQDALIQELTKEIYTVKSSYMGFIVVNSETGLMQSKYADLRQARQVARDLNNAA